MQIMCEIEDGPQCKTVESLFTKSKKLFFEEESRGEDYRDQLKASLRTYEAEYQNSYDWTRRKLTGSASDKLDLDFGVLAKT